MKITYGACIELDILLYLFIYLCLRYGLVPEVQFNYEVNTNHYSRL